MAITSRKSLFAPERSVEECLRLWETVCYRAQQAGDRQSVDFADRIAQQAGRPGWQASPMQLGYMRKMVDHFCPTGMAMDLDLIPGVSVGWRLEPVENTSPCERCNADGASLHMASGRTLCSMCAGKNRGVV